LKEIEDLKLQFSYLRQSARSACLVKFLPREISSHFTGVFLFHWGG